MIASSVVGLTMHANYPSLTCDWVLHCQVAEQVIREDPLSNLDMALCHNLCMMYDLENDQTSAAKKAVIVQLVKQYAADDFDSFSLL